MNSIHQIGQVLKIPHRFHPYSCFSFMQNRAITKQIGQHHFHFRVLFIMALYYDLSGDFFFRLEIATSIARPRVESGRGHEGVAPRCATLCATLHQLRRFKGKCCRSYFRKSATVAFSFVWFVVHSYTRLDFLMIKDRNF